MYHCQTCGATDQVTKRNTGRQRGYLRCLVCMRRKMKEWRTANPEKRKAQKKRWEAGRLKREPHYSRDKQRKAKARRLATAPV